MATDGQEGMMIMTISDSPALTGWSSSDDDYDGFASDFPNLHPVLERAPGVGIELLTPVSESSGRARHSWSIPKHSRGLINVPYGVAAAVRATPDFEICQHFKSGKTLLEARLTGSFKVKVVTPLLCHVGLSALPVFWSQVHSSL